MPRAAGSPSKSSITTPPGQLQADGSKARALGKMQKQAKAIGKGVMMYKRLGGNGEEVTAAQATEGGVSEETSGERRGAVPGSYVVPDDVKKLFKPYKGDLFGSGGEKSGGLLYLSRMHPDSDPERERRKRTTTTNKSDEETEKDAALPTHSEIPAEMIQHLRDKKRRFALSLATLSTKPQERDHLVSEGAIPALVALTREPDVVTKMSCALALMNLASEPELRGVMLDRGAAAAIVGLSKSKDRQIQKNCAIALCNLSALAGSENKLVSENAVAALLSMSTSSVQIMETCLLGLSNLSCIDEMYGRIEDVNVAVLQLSNFNMSPRMEQMLIGCL